MMRDKLDQKLGYGQVFDIKRRIISFNNQELTIYFSSFLVDNDNIVQLLLGFIETNYHDDTFGNKSVLAHLANHNLTVEENLDTIVTNILSGLVAIVINDETSVIVLDLRNYPGRSIGEPDSEKVVRGSRDGFTESIATNMGLIRRRIRSGRLRSEVFQIGDYSKTDVALIYLDEFVDQKALNDARDKIKNVRTVDLTMSDKALEELIADNNLSPYPLVRYTERPDTFVVHLYQGAFGILVDTSPSAILAPTTIFDHMQHAEEFRQTPISGTYLRILRMIGIILSFLLMPIWFTVIESDIEIPSFFSKVFSYEGTKNYVFLQIILAEVGLELLRMASIHTPNSLSTSMGLIAGVIIGDIAIELGLFTPAIVLIGSISAIGSFITPSYELSLANKIVKLILLFLIKFFGIYGFISGLILLIIHLATRKSFTRPYLYPLIPFSFKNLIKQLIRFPYRNKQH